MILGFLSNRSLIVSFASIKVGICEGMRRPFDDMLLYIVVFKDGFITVLFRFYLNGT
jgi:hypothetical protein